MENLDLDSLSFEGPCFQPSAKEEPTETGSQASGQQSATQGDRRPWPGSSCSTLATPPNKRRRNAFMSPSVKSEPNSDSKTATPLLCDDEDGVLEGPTGDRRCLGCNRSAQHSRDWCDPTVRIAWAFSGNRGFWCRECHGLWRVCFSPSHNLALLSKWLRRDANFEIWEMHLVAYISCIYEGASRVTADMVQDKIKVIKFLSGMLGWTIKPGLVMTLTQFAEMFPSMSPDPTNLVSMWTGSGAALGVALPREVVPTLTSASSVERPACYPPSLNNRSRLFTSSVDDGKLLGSLFDMDVAIAPMKSEEDDAMVVAPASKLAARLQTLLPVAQRLVEDFGSCLWNSVREAQFTRIAKDLSTLASEAGTEGNSDVMDEASMWAQGLNHGKTFSKLYREYGQVKNKSGKLQDFKDPLMNFAAFLQETAKVEPYPTMSLLLLKASWFAGLAEGSTISGTLASAIEAGMVHFLDKASKLSEAKPNEVRFSSEAWLRAIVFKMWCDALMVRVPTDEAAKECVAALAADILEVERIFLQTPGLNDLAAGLVDDIVALRTLTSCTSGSPTVAAKQVASAMEAVKSKRLEIVSKTMYNTPVGKNIMSAASLILQFSAQNAAADTKMESALNASLVVNFAKSTINLAMSELQHKPLPTKYLGLSCIAPLQTAPDRGATRSDRHQSAEMP